MPGRADEQIVLVCLNTGLADISVGVGGVAQGAGSAWCT